MQATRFQLVLLTILVALPISTVDAQHRSQLRGFLRGTTPQANEVGKNSASVKRVFRGPIQAANKATVRIYKGDRYVALGTIIDPTGYIVTKASEAKGTVFAKFEGHRYKARVIGVDNSNDLKLIKISAGSLPYAKLSRVRPSVGSWIAAPGGSGSGLNPLAVGVVSVATREIKQQHGALGIQIEDTDNGPMIERVFPDLGAKRAGLRIDDVILMIDSRSVPTRSELIDCIKEKRPGDRVRVDYIRDGETRSCNVTLSRRFDIFMGQEPGLQEDITGPLSVRRSGFASAIQHDCLLRPDQCGGPLVDLDGNVIGINIARSDRVSSLALTADVIIPWVDAIRNGSSLSQVQ